ncbi:MAG TPA: sodium:calcium antiporter [Bacteroidales bacterium]|nr:sodium:calcium antiporter [Bacteroidales bacterium]
MDYIFLFLGFVLLILSGDFLVKGSVSLAVHFKVSKLVIGVVLVSFGTSAPELVVSLDAAIKGHPDIAIGNVVGSNIANLALVLGLTAMILPIQVRKKAIHFDWSVMMLVSILFYIFCLNFKLQLFEGLIFIVLLLAYVFWSVHQSRAEHKINEEEPIAPKHNLVVSFILVISAIVGLIYGAELLVKGASSIASSIGIEERIISVTVIALGTSLPELATSIMAAIRKELDISIGNLIGSNIFNILAILGLTSVVKEIDINPMILKFDIFWMLGISLLLFLFILPLRKAIVSRWKGFIFVLIYIVYIYLAFSIKGV